MKVPKFHSVMLVLLGATMSPLAAQEIEVTADPLPCLPVQEHGLVRAQVENEIPGTDVRVYFRRLHEVVEDFYYIEMEGAGDGRYWAALPKPAKEELDRIELERDRADEVETEDERSTGQDEKDHPWAAWWKRKEASENRNPNEDLDEEEIRVRASVGGAPETRHWMDDFDLVTLEQWLDGLRYEPAEYFAAVVDHGGNVLAKSKTLVTEVLERDECERRLREAGLPVGMTPQERGFAFNLTVGETARWQMTGEDRDKEDAQGNEKKRKKKGGPLVFHWLCDHVVTRIDYQDVTRADDACRVCVIAWWQSEPFLAAAGLTGVTGILVDFDDPPVSPSRP